MDLHKCNDFYRLVASACFATPVSVVHNSPMTTAASGTDGGVIVFIVCPTGFRMLYLCETLMEMNVLESNVMQST